MSTWTQKEEAALETAQNDPTVTLNDATLLKHPVLSRFSVQARKNKWLKMKPEGWSNPRSWTQKEAAALETAQNDRTVILNAATLLKHPVLSRFSVITVSLASLVGQFLYF